MRTNIFVILIVILNNSLMFGGVHASSASNSEYGNGNVFEIEHKHGHNHKSDHSKSGHKLDLHSVALTEIDSDHEHTHKHGISAQLSYATPEVYTFEVEPIRTAIQISAALAIISPTYTPPVPPPNL